jgi:hypothetical protein
VNQELIELAWAAGFWDGEGCCSLCGSKKSRTKTVVLTVSQSFDPGCLQRFQRAIGGLGNLCGPYTRVGNPNQFWTWSTKRSEHVSRVMEMLLPYLSHPKRQQYEDAMRKRESSSLHLKNIEKPTKEKLSRLYIDEELTIYEIGSIYEVTGQCVYKWLKKFEISIKPKGWKVSTE